MRKILLSFLGTNKYLYCNYYLEGHPDQKVNNVKYIQEALTEIYCKNFSENDRILLFLTEKAEQMNFLDNGQYNRETDELDYPNTGLKSKLEKLKEQGYNFDLKPVRIKEGFSQDEVWSIFETVAEEINEGDEIILDITHAFRFLPMMGIVLLNYLKTTKNIIVKGIHYGAFEKLGTQGEVAKMEIGDRNAPILNLNTLLEFQSWTSAVNSFVKFGEVRELKETSQPQLKNILSLSKGGDEGAKNLRYVIDELHKLSGHLQTNRLNILLSQDFTLFWDKLKGLSEKDLAIKPFKQILSLVQKKVKPLVTSKDMVWLESAKWCLEHNLVQQAYTQLQEGMLTYCMGKIQNELQENVELKALYLKHQINKSFTFQGKEDRYFYSSLLNMIYKKSQNQLRESISDELTELALFFQGTRFEKLGMIYAYIIEPRNDINHAGMRNDPMKAEALQKRIGELIDQVENLIK